MAMKKIMTEWRKNILTESGLSRAYQHMTKHETAIITAFRDDPLDAGKCTDNAQAERGGENTDLQTNKRRNRELKATLLAAGYGVTAVDGSYIENYRTPEQVEKDELEAEETIAAGEEAKKIPEMIEVKEGSFFVVNLPGDSGFHDHIISLGERYCQDSVLLIPIGGKEAYAHGTNNSQWPGYGNRDSVGHFSAGSEGEFMTRVSNRPIVYKEELETYNGLSRQERMVVKAIASRASLIKS